MRRLLAVAFTVLISSVVSAAYAWDSLRPLTDFAKGIDLPLKIIVFLLAAAIFGVSILAYKKSGSKRILLVSIAFFLFALKWLVKIIDIVFSPGSFLSDSSENIFELLILGSLLVALFYRKGWEKS